MLKVQTFIFIIATILAVCLTPAYGTEASQCAGSKLTIAITLDDLPFVDQNISIKKQAAYTRRLLRALKKYHVPAIGFVNENKLLVNGQVEERINLLRDWLKAGMTLGNHGFNHLDLETTPLRKAEAAVLRGDVITTWLMKQYGLSPHYYRYPYNHTGPTKTIKKKFEKFLANHGYTIAPFTIQNDDYIYDKVYAYDLEHGKNKEAHKVLKAYLEHLPIVMQAHEKMTQELFGRQIAQIFDLHANMINAVSFDSFLGMLHDRGYCFVSLKQALDDPAYKTPDEYVGRYGMTWLRRWAKGRGVKFSVYPPDPQKWVFKRFKQILNKIHAN